MNENIYFVIFFNMDYLAILKANQNLLNIIFDENI